MKVLMIDDEREIVEVTRLCFELSWPGTTVISAGIGQKGLWMVQTEKPDVVLLDVGLPDVNGIEVLREIRRFTDVPVIMLTVHDEEHSIVKALDLGADDYITKPFSHVQLLSRVRAVQRRVQAGQPHKSSIVSRLFAR